jgi:transposase InsO family protein
VLRRHHDVFGDERCVRLGSISVGHLYNVRHSAGCRNQRVVMTKTRPGKASTIGVRKAPAPEGRPGFIRIDSVHQGDLDGVKGLYHINAVDCVTQWQVVASVQTISEVHLLSVIEQLLAQFTFEILGFHADNGSEYVNHRVAKMLENLRIEFTRSRPRHSNDNGLDETKNGAVVRKEFGYKHIHRRHAARFDTCCREYLNPFPNFHRPCLFATEEEARSPWSQCTGRIYNRSTRSVSSISRRSRPIPGLEETGPAACLERHWIPACAGTTGRAMWTGRAM